MQIIFVVPVLVTILEILGRAQLVCPATIAILEKKIIMTTMILNNGTSDSKNHKRQSPDDLTYTTS